MRAERRQGKGEGERVGDAPEPARVAGAQVGNRVDGGEESGDDARQQQRPRGGVRLQAVHQPAAEARHKLQRRQAQPVAHLELHDGGRPVQTALQTHCSLQIRP